MATGPITGREFAIIIEGLNAEIAGSKEAMIVHTLRRHLDGRFGDHRLERHYVDHVRVGYLTFVRNARDLNWLRLHVAVLVQVARLADGIIRARPACLPTEG